MNIYFSKEAAEKLAHSTLVRLEFENPGRDYLTLRVMFFLLREMVPMACDHKFVLAVACCLGIFSTATPASAAGDVVLVGDVTPLFRILDYPTTAQFFENVLGDGTQVAVLSTTLGTSADTAANSFYDGLTGVTSTLLTGNILASKLTNLDLLVLPAPDNTFTFAETTVIADFLTSGGDLLLLGDTATTTNIFQSITHINLLLLGLDSELVMVNELLDPGVQVATGNRILPHPLTAGVIEFGYGAAGITLGGTPLFLATTNDPIAAVETLIPEPASILLMLGGVLLIAYRRI